MALAAAAALTAVALSGIYRVADGEIASARWRWASRGRAVEPGLHWGAPLLQPVRRYPLEPFEARLSLRSTGDVELASREGERIRLSLDLRLRPDPPLAGLLDGALGDGWRQPEAISGALLPAAAGVAAGFPYDALLAGDERPSEALRDALLARLKGMGLRAELLSGPLAWPEIQLPPSSDGGREILLIGLDGADWRFIDPLIERGLMPNLARLVRGGVRARMRTITPMLSPIIWTSMATGMLPEKHGILDFLAVDSRTGREMPVTSSMRKTSAFWQILSTRGVSVGTVGWWATWPAEPVMGYTVTDRVAYQLFGAARAGEGLRGRTWPEGLILSLAPELREASTLADADLVELLGRAADPGAPDEAALRQILVSTRSYHHAAIRLLREYAPRVAAVYYEGTDTVAHLFMRYAPPRMPGVEEADVGRWGAVVERYYGLQDRLLGELLDAAGTERTVMIVSDHGFKSGPARPPTDPRIGVGMAADWHRKFGILAAAGPGIPAGSLLSDVSVLDVTPTLLALAGLPTAGDMDGRVIDAILGGTERGEPIASYEDRAAAHAVATGGGGSAEESVEREIIAKLTTLGYLGQTTPNASNNTGITLLQQGRAAEAEQAFRQAFEADPSFLPARLNIARALMARRAFDEALVELRAVGAADPEMPEVDNLIGNILMEEGDAAEAEQTFRRALGKDDRNPHLWNSLGIILARQGKAEAALEAYRRVEAIDGDYAEAINNAGLVHRERLRFPEAVAEFERAIRADPSFPGSYNNLGLVMQDQGDLDGALEAYERGLDVDPENSVIWNNRGSALLALGRTEEARDAFRRAVEEDPAYASAHNNLGAVLGMLGDAAGEMDELLKAIDLDPRYVDARLNLAFSLIRRGRHLEAIRALRQVLGMDEGNLRARLELGNALANVGKAAEALGELERLSREAPAWPPAHNALARLHLAGGRRAEARREAEASLALNPDQPAMRALLEEAGGPAATSGSKP